MSLECADQTCIYKACISYSSISNASSEANDVAKKLADYADHLETQIWKELYDCRESYTANVSEARSNVNFKICDLRKRSTAYSDYSQDLLDLKDKCIETDNTVKTNILSFTASFKDAYEISNYKVENDINYFLTSLGNSTSVGRWLGNKQDEAISTLSYIDDTIKTWYGYEGGRELVNGILVGSLEVIIAACTIVITICTGGALLVVIAGVIGGLIACSNGIANIFNECQAYKLTQNGDPATGRRRSDLNTCQDYLRSSFRCDESGEDYKYDEKIKKANIWANGIDIVNFVCSTITLVDGIGELAKNAYKWTTGSMADIGNLKIKDILTKDNFSAFKSKFVTTFSDVKVAIRGRNFGLLRKDFLNNLEKGYTLKIFVEDKKFSERLNHGATLVKNYSSIPKIFLEEGINLKSVFVSFGIETIVVPNISVAEIKNYKDGEVIFEGGKAIYKGEGEALGCDIDAIKLNDITDIPIDFGDLISDLVDLFKSNSGITVSIPEINMPNLSGINDFEMAVAY